MKRQLTSILLFSALLVGGASTFVSCTDHESDSAYNTSVSLADAIAQQKAKLAQVTEDLQNLTDQTDAIKDQVAANKRLLTETALAGLAQYGTLDEALQNSDYLNGKLDGIRDEIKAINDLYADDKEAAQAYKEALEERLAGLDETVANEAEAREALQKEYDKAFDYLINKKLDNIAINATENPVTGYWNAAFLGSQLNLASSFYGVAAEGSEDWNIDATQVLGKGGNAGYLYVSLNPTEIDPSLVKVELVNSQGEPAKGFELGAIEKTDKVLTYGYSRAASANGFYQIPVIATDPQNDDIALDKGSLKEAAQNILAELKNPKANDFDLTKVAAALYKNNLNNKLTAYTVKATYHLYDPSLKKLVEKHAVAQYNVAAFAVKPLSFNFAKDNATLDKLSGWAVENFRLPSLSSKLNKFADALDVKVELSADKQNINVYTIVALADVTVKYDEATKKAWFVDKNGAPIENSEIKNVSEVKEITSTNLDGGHVQKVYKITATDNTIANVISELNSQIAGKLQPIKNNINKVNNKWENVIAKVNPLLSKVASKIGSANKLLQPTILYMDKNNNPNTLSTLGGRLGTRFVGLGSTNLYATSWTAELLAPAYKKSISVKTVKGEGKATLTWADGTSAETNKIAATRLIFTADKPGTYAITYNAVDYSGVEATPKTFYVEVVK